MVLRFADRTVTLSEESAPFCFAGDVACDGTPMGGPVTDLNVMVRRGRFTAQVERLTGEAQRTLDTKAILVACGPVRVQQGCEVVSLDRFDAILFDVPQQLSLQGPAVLIEFAEV
jgi:environmental stress-induced protein Ves